MKYKFWIILWFIVLFTFPVNSYSAQSSSDSLVTWLTRLDPLQKVHYSWAVSISMDSTLLYQYARLTGAISLQLTTNYTQAQIDKVVQMCDSLNNHSSLSLDQDVSIGLNYSIWHQYFSGTDPTGTTGEAAELDSLRARLDRLQDKIDIANGKFASSDSVKVTMVLYDCENFTAGLTTVKDDSIKAKMDAVYDIAKQYLPQPQIQWYGLGGYHVVYGDPYGMEAMSYLTTDIKNDNFNCSLYRIWELADTRNSFRYTLEYANQNSVANATAWVALASGYVRGGATPATNETWTDDYNYDRTYSWQLGREMNNAWWGASTRWLRFAPWTYCEFVIFYPAPFDDDTPHWGEHFQAYVQGANNVSTAFPTVVP